MDIVPELLKDIKDNFNARVRDDKHIQRFLTRMRDKKARQIDTHDYAERLGEHLSAALQTFMTKSRLPDGKFYWNIADRTVRPMLNQNYELVNDAAIEVQCELDRRAGIGLKAIKGERPDERIKGILEKLCEEGREFEQALVYLGEPIINISEAFYDDHIKANAAFRTDAGMKATITRTVSPKCCDWCADLAGTYDYDRAPEDIYRRHEYCRCVVTYQSGRTRQDVWSKKLL